MSGGTKEYSPYNSAYNSPLADEEGLIFRQFPSQFRKEGRRNPLLTQRLKLTYSFLALFFVFVIWTLSRSKDVRKKIFEAEENWDIINPTPMELPHNYNGKYTSNPINSTFGFGKIFVLHLPFRSDKKDALLMMSRAQGFDLDFVHTRTPDQLQESGMPWISKKMKPQVGRTALYRGHMDAMQAILDNNLASALILEDDSDWDVDVKYALQRLQQPFATLVNSYNKSIDSAIVQSTKDDPWLSTEWDILNLGTCMEDPFNKDDVHVDMEHLPYVSYEDKTIEYRENTHYSHVDVLEAYNYTLPRRGDVDTTHHRRLAILSKMPICMNAYAVSRRGAIKMLYNLSREIISPFDWSYVNLVKKQRIVSYSVSPPLMSQWKMDGGSFRNSDKDHYNAGNRKLEDKNENHNPWIGNSENIKNSLRKHIRDKIEEGKPFM